VISEVQLMARLKAQIELGRDRLSVNMDQAMQVARLLAPHIRDIIRDGIADAKREWTERLERQR